MGRIFRIFVKIFYLLPAVAYCGFFGYVGLRLGFDGFPSLALLYALLLIAAAVLLWRNLWWGCVPGMAVGSIIIYLFETSHVHHHINETHIGVGVIIWFVVMGLICYQTGRRLEKR